MFEPLGQSDIEKGVGGNRTMRVVWTVAAALVIVVIVLAFV